MKSFNFKAKVWLWQGENPWHFISVDKKISEKIKKLQEGKLRRGWGAVKVKILIGKSFWTTSIFPDKRSGTYLLPLKSEIRKKEGIMASDVVRVKLELI
jgi:hypothetical protein